MAMKNEEIMKNAPLFVYIVLPLQFIDGFLFHFPKVFKTSEPKPYDCSGPLRMVSIEKPSPLGVSLPNSSSLGSGSPWSPETSNISLCDHHYWNEYVEIMSQIMVEPRVLKKCSNVEPVQSFLLDPTLSLPIEKILDAENYQHEESDRNDFRSEMNERHTSLLRALNLTKPQKQYMDRCLTYIGDRCASTRTVGPLIAAWLKWRLMGSIPRENSVSTYMYVLGLMGDDEICKECLWDVVAMHTLLFLPNERTTTLRIQSLISQEKPLEAEKLVESLSFTDDSSKLRTYTPILSYYCNEIGSMESALRLFLRMRELNTVHLDAATYALLLSSLASKGYLSKEATGALQVGSLSSGPQLFDDIAGFMATDLLELTESAAETLYSGFGDLHEGSSTSSGVEERESLIPMCSTTTGGVTFGRVHINETSGVCNATGVKLRSLTLDEPQKRYVRETLLEMAFSSQEEYRATAKTKNAKVDPPTGEYCRTELQNFSNWLKDRSFTAIVDGANVAHFGSGTVQYSQVKLMAEELIRLGEQPLVVMPSKYTTKKFYLRHIRMVQELNDKDIQALEDLKERGLMYIVPRYCFDDYFWMIASVTNLTSSGAKTDEERIPGQRPIIITNDQMRDHRLALLEARPFRRWTTCQIVNFSIGSYRHSEWESGRNLTLFPPSTFSREIQSNDRPENAGHRVWHFPVTGWDEPWRLCISTASNE